MATTSDMTEKVYSDFLDKVKRTVLLKNLAPRVTAQMVKNAIEQQGAVRNVQLIPNYTIPHDVAQVALVEMESQKQAEEMIAQMDDCPFILCSMPRPVKAEHAEAANFFDRPRKPGKSITFQWVKPSNPNFEACRRIRRFARKHATESAALLEYQLNEERKLAKQQEDTLKSNFMKFEMIERAKEDGCLARLAAQYNMSLDGAFKRRRAASSVT